MAARPVVGEGLDAMVWTVLIQHVARFDPALLNVAFVFLILGYGIIKNVEGDKLYIDFDRAGSKIVLASFVQKTD